ncbi:MAG: preprotein translocase subunit SecE [Parvularcula sp.]
MPKSKHRKKTKKAPAASASTGAAPDVKVTDKADDKHPPREKVSPLQFLRQVRDEARKVTWTTRNETMVSTIMVLIMVMLMSVFFLTIDEILRRVIPLILNITA